MLTCPRCKVPLRPVAPARGPRAFACPSCAGRATTLEALRPYAAPGGVAGLWQRAHDPAAADGAPCPSCARPMRAVDGGGPASHLDLDACPRCRLVWFDPSEMARFAPPRDPLPSPDAVPDDLPEEARVALATLAAEKVRRQSEGAFDEAAVSEVPDEPWQWIPAILGLPMETGDRPVRQRVPWMTWATAAAILLGALFALRDLSGTVDALGFKPAEPWRGLGLTWLSSLVLHGGLLHLFGNLYFLVMAGDDVEDVLGPARWLLLFVLAGVAGNAAHALLDPRPTVPLVGASGAISGLLAFYALRFPGARLSIAFNVWWRFAFLKVPVWAVVALWLLVQVAGAWAQRAGCGAVSAFAHLGGFAVGAAFWAWTVWTVQPAAARAP